jgi:glycosyltransferase involved in cell wall biosynthesis
VTRLPPGVELAGYLDAAVGVGEAARRYVTALRSVGVPVRAHPVALPGRDSARTRLPSGAAPAADEIGFNLLCLNPEQLDPYMAGDLAPPRAGRANIGVWSWEVDVIPSQWRNTGEGLCEIWTYSEFAAQRIAAGVNRQVLSMPPPVSHRELDAQPLDLPGGFRFLVMFDYLSTLERKNPLGAIEAYTRAFGPQDGTVLIVKSVNGRHRVDREAQVIAAIGGRPDIVRVDQTMSGADRDALITGCDCFLSLHRSEGHGLPLAEAMARAKPVVATGYGGNTEFMDEHNSYLVAWDTVAVGEGVEHYSAAATWAEPDIDDAVRQLREVCEHPDEARERAARASVAIRSTLSPEETGARMCARLEELGAQGVRRRASWWHARRNLPRTP